ncbi:MAG: hypothetical protein P9M00_12690 [Candidatus Tritonobacter lacicola]|nr:hypothetical protein [Candidatus Tritonobacter lacicola]
MKPIQAEISFPVVERGLQAPADQVEIDTSFPEDTANALAKLESFNKHLFRPNTYLHKWWARRSGTTFRFILKQLAPDSRLRNYYLPGGLEGIRVLDPMMGGGTTLHEAIRLGANVVGYDIDPIPVLQARASLTATNLYEKEEVFAKFLAELERCLGRYFVTTCPECGTECETQYILHGVRKRIQKTEYIVVDSYILREEPDGGCLTTRQFYPDNYVSRGKRAWRLIEKSEFKSHGANGRKCELLNRKYANRYIPLVVVGLCPQHGQFFREPSKRDIRNSGNALRKLRGRSLPARENAQVPAGPKSNDLLNRQINTFLDVFSPRQLLYLSESKRIIEDLPQAHRLWLALLVSTSLEFNSMLCGYKGYAMRRPGAVRHVFSHHAYSFPYTALEDNPVFTGKTSGTLRRLFQDRIRGAGVWAREPIERKADGSKWRKIIIHGECDIGHECMRLKDFEGKKRQFIIKQQDSSRIPLSSSSIDFVVTDPPYYDSVQYSDLSHFFRCWLRWFLPYDAVWKYEPLASAVAETDDAGEKFGTILGKIWKECNRVLRRPHGRLIFTYHNWRSAAWAHLSIALRNAHFRLANAYIVHSENPISVHIRDLHALKHDCILVLKPDDLPDQRRWEEPTFLSLNDSRSFCKGCAEVLGWVLQTAADNNTVFGTWKRLLGED